MPWNLTLHCSIWISSVLPVVESDSALFYLNQQCPACRGIWLCIALFDSAVSCLPWHLTLHCSIRISGVLPSWNLTLHCSIWLSGVLPAVESDSALFCLTQRCSACRGILLCIVLFYSVVSCSPRISTPQLRALRRVWLHDVHGVGIRSMWCICFRLIWLCPWNRNSLQNYFSLFINRL